MFNCGLTIGYISGIVVCFMLCILAMNTFIKRKYLLWRKKAYYLKLFYLELPEERDCQMKIKGEKIEEYRAAFKNGTEGVRLLETMQILNALKCSEEKKTGYLTQEIDHIICGYMSSLQSYWI